MIRPMTPPLPPRAPASAPAPVEAVAASPLDLVLTTPRLRLRALRPSDAAAVFRVFSDPEVMRYWSTPPWDDEARSHAFIEQDLRTMAAGEHLRLALTRREDGVLLGTVSLFARSPACRRAEIGFALARPAWGRGYATEAATAVLDHGFRAWDLNRVEADIDPRNAAAARVLRRLGFVREGLLRERWIVGGEACDSEIFGLLRADWRGAALTDGAAGEPAPEAAS